MAQVATSAGGLRRAVPAEVVAAQRAAAASAASGTAGSPATSAVTAEKPAESERLNRLKTLTYDRRPSTILNAWSGLDGTAAEKPDTADEPAPPAMPIDRAVAEKEALESELKTLQRNVTLGHWNRVQDYFAGLTAEEAKAGYSQMLRSLASPPQPEGLDPRMAQMSIPGVGRITEANLFQLEDVLELIDACPHERDDKIIRLAAPLLNLAMQRGVADETLIDLLKAQAAAPPETAVLTKQECAWLLRDSGRIQELEPFLPTAAEAIDKKDAESLVLLSRCTLQQYYRDRKAETLETCWSQLQSACFMTVAKEEHRKEALALALSLVPRIREDLGIAWLEKTFSEDPEFGMRIINSTGTSASTALQTNPMSPDGRLQNLKVQKTVVESLLTKAPERAAEWQETLRMMADVWLREGEFTRQRDYSSSRGPRLQRDFYGNLYYMNMDGGMGMSMSMQNGNQPQPISTSEMLEVGPSEEWLAQLDETIVPRYCGLYAQLHLKVGEEDEAFPYIERVAKVHPVQSRDLIHEFIRVWTRNHDPNANRGYTSPYMYMYGFDMKADGIPLTRSKQERNLSELTKWVKQIRGLTIEELDESLFAKAFTTCHSSAEVYQLNDIEDVFGAVGGLDPKTLAQLVEQMRGNLAGVWRAPATQETAKTKRKQKDIEAEVIRGYEVANKVVQGGLKQHGDNWRLLLAKACLDLDEATFRNEVATSSQFSEQRLAALQQFQAAAAAYANEVPSLKEEEQVATVYEHWFYAGLGASDLGRIDHKSTPDPNQPALIRKAIDDLPGEAAEFHQGKFANSLFTRMSSLNAAVKFSYLKAGFEIVGDHEQAREARDVYDYYNDLVTEIQLVTRIDGSNQVGHDKPFGVFVEIHHTGEIERESGGFAKYLQNQQNASYGWNYGRPLENYRDKFEEGIRTALVENFEVLSVTFYDEKEIRSLATEKYGWRNTPYAYVLVKPNGPQIDKLPSLKIDLDFLDTSGYVVLPVTSAPLPIDASPADAADRPYEKLEITQILDEREASEEKLQLEVKATARGLVPDLDRLLDVKRSDFEVAEIDDQGVLVSRFDTEAGGPSVITERTWIIDYRGRTDLEKLPTAFQFPLPKSDEATVAYMRYEDADLKTVESTVTLEEEYGEVQSLWPWYLGGGLLAALLLVAAIVAVRKSRETVESKALELPDELSPFDALSILQGIRRSNGFDPATSQELSVSIESIERYYFAGEGGRNGNEPNLRAEAERWMKRAK